MADDDLQITHVVIPRKWMVAVLGVMISALGSGATAVYKYGSVAGRLTELEKHCLSQESVPVAAEQSPEKPSTQVPSWSPDPLDDQTR